MPVIIDAFRFEEEPKRARHADTLDLAKTLYKSVQGNGDAAAVAARLSRLTGPRSGKLQATELQAEMRWARVAIDRLRLQLQLSCPHLLRSRTRIHPLDATAAAGASRNEIRSSLCFQPLANCGCTIRYTNTLRFTR